MSARDHEQTSRVLPVTVVMMAIVSMIIMPMIVICLNNIIGVGDDRCRNWRNGCGYRRSADRYASNNRNRKHHLFDGALSLKRSETVSLNTQ